MKPKDAADLRCSFCTKAHAEVKKLIAGPNDVAICDECVDICNDIIADGHRFQSTSVLDDDAASEAEMLSFKCPACGHKWAIPRK